MDYRVNTKNKFLLMVTLMLAALATATIVNVGLNFREFAINAAVDKSKLTANIVKDGLTAHMVNGIMEKRKYFLDTITQNNEVKKVSINISFTTQFGDKKNYKFDAYVF